MLITVGDSKLLRNRIVQWVKPACFYKFLFSIGEHACVPQDSHGGKRSISGKQFSPSTMLVSGIEFRLLAWWQAALLTEMSHWPQISL